MPQFILRIIACIILLFSILFMPFWTSAILALAAMVYFSFFWEAALLFLLSDFLYGAAENRFLGVVFLSFIIFILLLLLTEFFKKSLNFNLNNYKK